ncbi:MAG TPA: hypothetical protein VF862_07775 [Gemmatimonadales bacterium]
MSAYRNQQHRLVHRGKEFHFVSYEGLPADVKTARPAGEPMWYLITAGKRWACIPFEPGQDEAGLDRVLVGWLEANVFA